MLGIAVPVRSVQAPVAAVTFRSPAMTVPGVPVASAFQEARVPPAAQQQSSANGDGGGSLDQCAVLHDETLRGKC
jgi:hypothetical protein